MYPAPKIYMIAPAQNTGRESGIALIQVAILLPLFALLLLGVLEFGFNFLKYEVAERDIAKTSDMLLKMDTTNPNTATFTQNMATVNDDSALVSFAAGNKNGNYICAQSYATQTAAASGSCSSGTWSVSPPIDSTTGAAASPYYIYIKTYLGAASLTPLGQAWQSPYVVTNTVTIGATSSGVGASANAARTWFMYNYYDYDEASAPTFYNGGRSGDTLYKNTTNSDVEVSISVYHGHNTVEILQDKDCLDITDTANIKTDYMELAAVGSTNDSVAHDVFNVSAVIPPNYCYYVTANSKYNPWFSSGGADTTIDGGGGGGGMHIWLWSELSTNTFGAYVP